MRRILSILILASLLLLAGCVRPAEESFEPLDSQSSENQVIPQNATDLPEETDIPVLVIDPNATDEEDVETEEAAVETEEVVETEEAVETEEEVEEATPTLRVINPTATNEAIASSTPNVIPTATQVQFITPEVNVEAVIPSATATVFVEQPTLEPTPTTFGDTEFSAGECEYIVQNGDTLFRIALNNDVSLAVLLEANGLSESSIIQPDQVLTIPNCDGEEAEEPEAVETEEAVELTECDYVVQSGDTLFEIALDNEIDLDALLEENDLTEASIIQPEQVLRFPNCEDGSPEPEEEEAAATEASSEETVHTVVSGDTLLSIARTYGVTVNDIIQANNIPNPNNLTVGQQLVIPAAEDGE